MRLHNRYIVFIMLIFFKDIISKRIYKTHSYVKMYKVSFHVTILPKNVAKLSIFY